MSRMNGKKTDTHTHTVPSQKNDKAESENYRGISLVSHTGNVFLEVAARGLTHYCETKGLLLEEQCGF